VNGAIKRVAVCGAGAMGSGIAQVAAQAGARVTVFDAQVAALEAGQRRVADSLDALAERGRLTSEESQSISVRITWTSSVADLTTAELVIEAIIEDEAIKRTLFEDVERVIEPTAILASNTSSLSITELARSLRHPARFVGMHFFNPAQVMKLVEIVAGDETASRVRETAMATAKNWGKVAVAVADVPGFIVNRVARPFYAEAFAALSEGAAKAEVIDHLFRSAAGFRMGPLELTDLIGQDVNYAVARSIYEAYNGRTRFQPQEAQADLVRAGLLGRKTGQGVYRHPSTERAPASRRSQAETIDPPTKSGQHAAVFDRLMERRLSSPGEWEAIEGTIVKWGEGRTALAESASLGSDVAILDWSNGSATAPIGFAASSDAAANTVMTIASAVGRDAFRIADRPGLLLLRTLAQLANAACDAVGEQVADKAAIDAAMRFGGNYPYGLFEWMDGYGRNQLVRTLSNIAAETGSPMYAPSAYLTGAAVSVI